MATTAGTTSRLVALGGMSGTGAVQTLGMTAEDSAIAEGDVLVFASEDVDEDNSDPGIGLVVGVALNASAAAKDVILVAMALPGQFFEANSVDEVTDQVGVAAEDIGVHGGIVESTDGFACFNLAEATNLVAMTVGYGRQTNVTQDSSPLATAGVGVTNPRVIFGFSSGVFFIDS